MFCILYKLPAPKFTLKKKFRSDFRLNQQKVLSIQKIRQQARTVARKCSMGGGLYVCVGGLDILKIDKNPLIYIVS